MREEYVIGVDPGVKTGLAIKKSNTSTLFDCKTVKIHQAFEIIQTIGKDSDLIVYVEDARLRKWFGSKSKHKVQGAGAIKIECKIWEDFLIDMKKRKLIKEYYMVAPKDNTTKVNETYFKLITKYNKRTSEHARDAGMLIIAK